jgi:hypothetical protein
MKLQRRWYSLALLPLAALVPSMARDDCPDDEEIELGAAEVFIEFNSTDGDFGIQFFWDGEAWDSMRVANPRDQTVLRIKAWKNVREQGLTEGFFESDEPSADELSMKEFLRRFPAGTYEFEGETLEGDELVGETELSHVIPAPPSGFFPGDGALVAAGTSLLLSFDAVTTDLEGEALEPELYEVVVESAGEILRVFKIVLPGDVANPMVTLPPEFLAPGEYKFEVIVQEESGNRTIAETEFTAS